MKVLSLDRPWAWFVRLGVKTVETRSWALPSSLIGEEIAIHMTQRRSGCLSGQYGPWHFQVESGCLWRRLDEGGIETLFLPFYGCIVATGTVDGVVPMVDGAEPIASYPPRYLAVSNGNLAMGQHDGVRSAEGLADLTDQRPFGDFTPGRFAVPLSGVKPVDPPVPFKGGQGLSRTWMP